MKTIYKYFKINSFVYIFALISIITASFIHFIIISSLIIVHELGHFLTALLFNVEVDKIYIYPFGGISKFHLPLNASIRKELLILLAGPMFQQISCFILLFIFHDYYSLIKTYHYGILFFNLLPIYPLDGGKLVNLLLSAFLPYKISLVLTIVISYLTITTYLALNITNLKINNILIVIFLVYKVITEQERLNYLYEKFLLERYLHTYNFKSCRLIKNHNGFYRNKRHLIKENHSYYLEKDYLEKKYKKIKKVVDNKKSLC